MPRGSRQCGKAESRGLLKEEEMEKLFDIDGLGV